MAIQARRIVVHGRVQGVGFRYFVQRAGSRLGLTGKVWNRPDSAVEIVAEGSELQLEAILREDRQGPRMSEVDRVDVEEIPAGPRQTSFTIEGF
jgi:acylphosphatase